MAPSGRRYRHSWNLAGSKSATPILSRRAAIRGGFLKIGRITRGAGPSTPRNPNLQPSAVNACYFVSCAESWRIDASIADSAVTQSPLKKVSDNRNAARVMIYTTTYTGWVYVPKCEAGTPLLLVAVCCVIRNFWLESDVSKLLVLPTWEDTSSHRQQSSKSGQVCPRLSSAGVRGEPLVGMNVDGRKRVFWSPEMKGQKSLPNSLSRVLGNRNSSDARQRSHLAMDCQNLLVCGRVRDDPHTPLRVPMSSCAIRHHDATNEEVVP